MLLGIHVGTLNDRYHEWVNTEDGFLLFNDGHNPQELFLGSLEQLIVQESRQGRIRFFLKNQDLKCHFFVSQEHRIEIVAQLEQICDLLHQISRS